MTGVAAVGVHGQAIDQRRGLVEDGDRSSEHVTGIVVRVVVGSIEIGVGPHANCVVYAVGSPNVLLGLVVIDGVGVGGESTTILIDTLFEQLPAGGVIADTLLIEDAVRADIELADDEPVEAVVLVLSAHIFAA